MAGIILGVGVLQRRKKKQTKISELIELSLLLGKGKGCWADR